MEAQVCPLFKVCYKQQRKPTWNSTLLTSGCLLKRRLDKVPFLLPMKVNWNQVVGIVAGENTLCLTVLLKAMLKLLKKLDKRRKIEKQAHSAKEEQ